MIEATTINEPTSMETPPGKLVRFGPMDHEGIQCFGFRLFRKFEGDGGRAFQSEIKWVPVAIADKFPQEVLLAELSASLDRGVIETLGANLKAHLARCGA